VLWYRLAMNPEEQDCGQLTCHWATSACTELVSKVPTYTEQEFANKGDVNAVVVQQLKVRVCKRALVPAAHAMVGSQFTLLADL
jgi:hypothetical protein